MAQNLFYTQGFRATTLRQIAAGVGIQVGSLYNHMDSKGQLLVEIMEGVLHDLLQAQRLRAANPDVVERLGLLIYQHVIFHGERAREVFIGSTELRSLERAQLNRITALRREYELIFVQTLEDGIQQGKFLVLDTKVTSYGILAMASSVAAWYSQEGRLSLECIADAYATTSLRSIWNPVGGSLGSRLKITGNKMGHPSETER